MWRVWLGSCLTFLVLLLERSWHGALLQQAEATCLLPDLHIDLFDIEATARPNFGAEPALQNLFELVG